MYTPPRVKQAASGSCLIAQGHSSSLGDGPGERGCHGLGGGSGAKGHLHIHGDSLSPSETTQHCKATMLQQKQCEVHAFSTCFFLSFCGGEGKFKNY